MRLTDLMNSAPSRHAASTSSTPRSCSLLASEDPPRRQRRDGQVLTVDDGDRGRTRRRRVKDAVVCKDLMM